MEKYGWLVWKNMNDCQDRTPQRDLYFPFCGTYIFAPGDLYFPLKKPVKTGFLLFCRFVHSASTISDALLQGGFNPVGSNHHSAHFGRNVSTDFRADRQACR